MSGPSEAAIVEEPQRPANLDVPRGSCDCHVHVIGDPALYPMSPSRSYTPPPATAQELDSHLRRLGLDRVVVVTPSTYGADNRTTLDAVKEFGRDRARAVAVFGDRADPPDVRTLCAGGVAGIRINLEASGTLGLGAALTTIEHAFAVAAASGWHVQIYAKAAVIASVAGPLNAAPVPLVFDHFGGVDASAGLDQSGFEAVLSLLRSGRAYVKLSAAYRASGREPDYPDLIPFVRALVDANPDGLLWGSDWPHPDSRLRRGEERNQLSPNLVVDDGRLLSLLATWVPDPDTRRKVLVHNPARLYGFDSPTRGSARQDPGS